MPLRVGTLLRAATPHQAEAVEALQLDGVHDTPTPTQAAPLEVLPAVPPAVTRCTQLAAAAVHLVAAPGMWALFAVYSQKSMQPKQLCTITVAVEAHLAGTLFNPMVRRVGAAAATPLTDTPPHVSCIPQTWVQRPMSRI